MVHHLINWNLLHNAALYLKRSWNKMKLKELGRQKLKKIKILLEATFRPASGFKERTFHSFGVFFKRDLTATTSPPPPLSSMTDYHAHYCKQETPTLMGMTGSGCLVKTMRPSRKGGTMLCTSRWTRAWFSSSKSSSKFVLATTPLRSIRLVSHISMSWKGERGALSQPAPNFTCLYL